MSQATKPSLTVLGGLLLLAAIVAVALWMSVQFGADDDTTIPSTILPPGATEPGGDADLAPGAPDDADVAPGALDDGQATGDTTQQVPDSVAPSAGAILSVEAYDPDGDNDENDDEAVLALADGNPSTNWRTVCYGGEFMGGKRGVGLVVTLDGFAQRALTVDVLNGPYIVDFFTSANDNVPATLDGWDNQLGARQFAAEGETIASDVPTTPTRHLLVLLKQIGRDTGCTENNPYRGGLGEIALI